MPKEVQISVLLPEESAMTGEIDLNLLEGCFLCAAHSVIIMIIVHYDDYVNVKFLSDFLFIPSSA